MANIKQLSSPITLVKELLQRESITPNDAGCQVVIREYLQKIGFEITDMSHGSTTNTWAVKKFSNGPTLLFSGHTDVVASGSLENWQINGRPIKPFDLTEINGKYYGRGIADMKGSIASMLSATYNFMNSKEVNKAKGTFAYLITSDEEANSLQGTQFVVKQLNKSGVQVDYCLIGESSSLEKLGDRIYFGRRGSHSLSELKINGLQGHVAKSNGVNAAAIAAAIINKAYATNWDNALHPDFEPTVFEVTEAISTSRAYGDKNNDVGSGENIVPDRATIRANWRYNPNTTPAKIEQKFTEIATSCFQEIAGDKLATGNNLSFVWTHNGDAFQTQKDSKLLSVTQGAVKEVLGAPPKLSTSGGTSDGRFIAPTLRADVIELGMVGDTIHCPNENIESDALEKLAIIYEGILVGILTD